MRGSLTSVLLLLSLACGGSTSPEMPDPIDEGAGPMLSGAADAPAVAAIPDSLPDVRIEDYDEIGGVRLSHAVALIRLAPTARVGEVNALLTEVEGRILGGVSGVAGRTPGLLTVRVPTTTQQAFGAALALIRARPFVLGASADASVADLALPRNGTDVTTPDDWIWELPSQRPGGGNWGFERSRVPQMWHLNSMVAREGVATRVGVWEDNGFDAHPDIAYEARLGLAASILPDAHAINVASVIGARHNNGGIDGVSPFARLVVGAFSTGLELPFFTVARLTSALRTWAASDARVVNVSFGLNYNAIGSATDQLALADEHGAAVHAALATLQEEGRRLPLFVVAAGNGSAGEVKQQTRVAGPLQNAAVAQNVAAILVVENLAERFGGGVLLDESSTIGGRIAAPGSEVRMLSRGNGFDLESGTSFSAPFVAGVAAYLYSLHPALPQPTLTTNPVADLLIRTATPVPGSAPAIDAFAAVIESDILAESDRARRGLTDIDDGTGDGNTRVDPLTQREDTSTVLGSDGRTTMADFRRWRDWVLSVEGLSGVDLNGRADHPKRDLNGDGILRAPAEENIFARGDFNGDGILSLSTTAPVPAAVGGGSQTDLAILQRGFDDPDYQAAELPALVLSGDVHLSPAACPVESGGRVRMRVDRASGGFSRTHDFRSGEVSYVFSVPIVASDERYIITVARLDNAGTVLATRADTVGVTLGGDVAAETACTATPRITTTTLQPAVVGQSYVAVLAAVDLSGTPAWSLVSGALPAGLTLGATTGFITGRPTTAGTSRFGIRVTAGAASPVRELTLEVLSEPITQRYSGTTRTTVSNTLPVDRTCELRTLRAIIRGSSFDLDVVAPTGSSPACVSFTTVQSGTFISIQPDGSFQRTNGLSQTSGTIERYSGTITPGGLRLRYEQGQALNEQGEVDPNRTVFRIDFEGAVVP